MAEPSHAGPLDEYSILGENMRHQDQLLFANLTVFATLNGAVAAFLFTTDPPVPDLPRIAAELAGAVFGAVFWVAASVYFYRWNHFFRRAIELEGTLGFSQYRTMKEAAPTAKRVGIWAWHTLFGASVLFWAILGLRHLAG